MQSLQLRNVGFLRPVTQNAHDVLDLRFVVCQHLYVQFWNPEIRCRGTLHVPVSADACQGQDQPEQQFCGMLHVGFQLDVEVQRGRRSNLGPCPSLGPVRLLLAFTCFTFSFS